MATRRTGNRRVAIAFLTVSLIAAVSATATLYAGFQHMEEMIEAQQVRHTIPVVVAAREISPGTQITEEDLRILEVESDYVAENTLTDTGEALGRVPRQRILIGEAVRSERLAPPEAGEGLQPLIPFGYRALSLNITDASAVSGFLSPGNYVDVLVTMEDSKGMPRTLTLLQAVQLLAVNANINTREGAHGSDDKQKPSVTLAVTPDQAQRVTHANVQGEVVLTLRNDINVTQQDTHGVKTSKLIGRPDKRIPIVRPPVAPNCEEQRLTVVNGDSREIQLSCKTPGSPE